MNNHISRIESIDKQLKAIDRIAKQGDYLGAGLSIQMTVGVPVEGAGPDLDIGLCNNLEQILDTVKTGLQQARKERTAMAKAEFNELQSFFEKEGS